MLAREWGGMDAHHIFPQKFASFFKNAGMNIHDPKNLSWWGKIAHNSAAKAYNKAWTNFITRNPNANIKEIEAFGNSLMKKNGF